MSVTQVSRSAEPDVPLLARTGAAIAAFVCGASAAESAAAPDP